MKFTTSDGFTLRTQGKAWTDDDLLFGSDSDGWPIDDQGERLEGKLEMITSDLHRNVAGIVPSKARPGRIVAAGPITKQPGTMPYRVVLVDMDSEYAVYFEMFDIDDLNGVELDAHGCPANCTLADACTHDEANSWTDEGECFQPNQFADAVAYFADRVKSHTTQVKSLFRILASRE